MQLNTKKLKKTLLFLLLVFALTMTRGNSTLASSHKKSTQLKIVVADTYWDSTWGSIASHLRSLGCKVYLSRTGKIDVKKYDALILPGGGDINPKRYHEKKHGSKWINDKRDTVQLRALKAFEKAGKPVLGICRGMQLINVYFGGSLKQNISGHWSGRWRNVSISKGSLLRKVYGSKENTYHFHHQAAKRIGEGLIVTERAGDGTVEALEHESLPIYGFQWHPEFMGSRGDKAYKEFLKVVRKYKKAK